MYVVCSIYENEEPCHGHGSFVHLSFEGCKRNIRCFAESRGLQLGLEDKSSKQNFLFEI